VTPPTTTPSPTPDIFVAQATLPTQVGSVDGARGIYSYRGLAVPDLIARGWTYDDAWRLLLDGRARRPREAPRSPGHRTPPTALPSAQSSPREGRSRRT
jgi:citrate synthase